MSNACFQQATYDFSEVKKGVNRLRFSIQRQLLRIEMFISNLIPAESHIYCQRQEDVVVDSSGVACLVKNIKS